MLRIQNCLQFKDPVGRIYQTGERLLSLRDNAQVYSLTDNDQYLFVWFMGENHPSENAIQTMCDCASDACVRANVLWPELICYRLDDDMFCGFLTKAIPMGPELTVLSRVLPKEVDIKQRLTLGRNLANCIHAVHQTSRRYVLGAPQPGDFHLAADGRVVFCYAYRCAMDVRDAHNSIFVAPECRAMHSGPSAKADAFSFAMILFLLLTGTLPFGGQDPEANFDEEQIVDMILNGESIYYYEYLPQAMALAEKISAISPALSQLFRETFDYCGYTRYDDHRPCMEDWIIALEKPIELSSGQAPFERGIMK